jgi:hypothetical protein
MLRHCEEQSDEAIHNPSAEEVWIAWSLSLLAMTRNHIKKRAKFARSLLRQGLRRGYAACLCIAPLVDAVPRIALIERSIAAHSRPISAAARPSA